MRMEKYGSADAKAVVERFYPEVSKGLERVYRGNAEVPFVSTETEKFFCDMGMYKLLVSATSRPGIRHSSMQAEYGSKGQISLRGSLKALCISLRRIKLRTTMVWILLVA